MTISPEIADRALAASHPLQIGQVDELLKLQKAAQKIASILDLDQLIEKIVNDVAHTFGYVEASIYLHNEGRGEMVLLGVHGCTIDCTAHILRVGKDGMVGYVAATGKTRYAPDVRVDEYYIACDDSTRSQLAIPLHVEDRLVGVFMASHCELDAFQPDQRRLLQALCEHFAVAVHNARLFQHERREREKMNQEGREARTIQQALLPKSCPSIPGFTVTGLCVPAGAVGGDWYDFIPLDDGRWGLVLADVSGKGTAAALLMSATRGMLRSLAETASGPGEVLGRLNRLLVDDFPSGKFVTMLYAVLDPIKRTLTYSSAGHLRPLLLESDGTRFLNSERGIPLGLGFGSYSELEIPLSAGSRLVFYSDGITEAANSSDEEYGSARLDNHVLQPESSPESILADVHSFTNGTGLCDDATVIMLRAAA
jgi:sigma-B regulation protein RsbU (phosphoserine phosphatase)